LFLSVAGGRNVSTQQQQQTPLIPFPKRLVVPAQETPRADNSNVCAVWKIGCHAISSQFLDSLDCISARYDRAEKQLV